MIQTIDKREYDSLRRGIAALLKGENSDSRRALEFQRVRSYWEVGHRLSEAILRDRWSGTAIRW